MARSYGSVISGGGVYKVNVLWFLIGAVVGGLSGSIAYFIFSKIRSTKPSTLDITDDISRLIGKIQHVTNTNIDTLDKKIFELRSVIHIANEVYIKLNEGMADRMHGNVESVLPQNFEEKPYDFRKEEQIFKDLDKTERVVELAKRGWDSRKIAESLGMGIGEVELILNLNSAKLQI